MPCMSMSVHSTNLEIKHILPLDLETSRPQVQSHSRSQSFDIALLPTALFGFIMRLKVPQQQRNSSKSVPWYMYPPPHSILLLTCIAADTNSQKSVPWYMYPLLTSILLLTCIAADTNSQKSVP